MRWLSYADLYNLVTWCHIKKGPLAHFFNKNFLHFLVATGNVWRALDTYVTSHEMCATAEIWESCWHVSRPELHARSHDVNRVTEVWICVIEFNVKSPLISQMHALTLHELTWREDSVSPALFERSSETWPCIQDTYRVIFLYVEKDCCAMEAHRSSSSVTLKSPN